MSDRVRNGDRVAGVALLVSAAFTIVAMAHHPTSPHAGPIGPIVHAAMIALLGLTLFGFAHFSVRRGLDRPAVLAGLVAYGVGMFGHVGAATISGFIVPALAGHGTVDHDLFLLSWESNQALANLGVVAAGIAFLLWSLDFLGRPGAEPRAIGLMGLVAGSVPAALLVGGWLTLNVAGAFIAYAFHAAWCALVGLHLLRGGLDVTAAEAPGGT